MKNFYKSLIFFLFILFSFNASATHYMGGEITWVCDNQGRYVFTVKVYRDCNGVPLQGNISLRVHNYPNPGQFNTTFPLSRQVINDISATCGGSPCNPTNTRIATTTAGAVEEHIYTSAPQRLNGIPGAAGWIFTFEGSTRNNAIDNLTNPGGRDLLLRAKMFAFNGQNASTCYDNSPNFAEVPSSVLCTGDAFTYNHNAQDDELDSLVYSWAEPLDGLNGLYVEASNPRVPFVNGYSFTSPFPGTFQNPNNVPASLNTENGEISYTSFTDGEFVSCVRVESYRCGQKIAEIYRDIQTVLLSSSICSPNDPPFIRAPFESSPGVFNVYRDTVKAGDLVTFNLQVQDFPSATNPNADSVRVFASGLQFGANFSNPNSGCLNPPCATLSTSLPGSGFLAYQSVFNWQTSCNHISFNDGCVSLNNTYNFVIRATDNSCPAPGQTVTTISITVLADDVIESPDIYCLDVNPNGDVDLTWNQPIDTTNSFNAWLIYSGVNPNGPFNLIDSIFNYNTLSYTHVGAGADAGQRYYYVRSRSGCNDAVINVAKDTLSTIFVDATLDAANSCADLNWNPFNSLGSSGNYRIFKDGTQISTTNATTTNLCNPITNCADTITYRVVRDNNQNACSSSSNTFEFIYKAPDPIADFSFVAACVVDPVVFTDLSTVTAGTITDWSWDFGDGSGISTLQNPSYTYSTPGTYAVELTVTTNLNCQATVTKNVTLNPGPPVDAGTNQSICVGQSTTIGGSPTTTGGNSVTWSPAIGLSSTTAFNPTANPTVTTTYTVTVTDGTACSSTDQVTVTVSPIPAADAGTNQAICLGESITIGGSPTGPPTSTYLWSPTTGLSSPTAANPTASPSITTTYTVTVTTGPNCTATDQVTVTVNPSPTADAGSDQTVCTGTTVTLGGAPTTGTGNTVIWSPAAGLSSATALNPTVTPTATTTYTVTTTNSFNCTQTDQVTITVNPNATTNAGPDRTICIGGSVGIGSPSIAGSTYSWSPSLGLSSTTVSNPTASPATTTTYTVSVVDANGCTGTDQVVVNVNPSAAADAGPDVIICVGVGQAIGGSPTGNTGSTYLWSPATGLSSTTVANPIANPSSATTYTVLVTDANGCTGTDQVLVSIGSVPTVDAGSDQAICSGGSISIGGSPTGAATSTFAWSPAVGLSSVTAANPTASPTTTTTYTVVVTDASGCTATDQMTVTVNPSPTISAGPDQAVCPGGSIAIGGTPTGPSGSTYTWSPSATLAGATTANPVATPVATTTYTVTVTDGNGCTNTDDVVVSVNNVPTADAGVDQTICNGSGVVIGGSPTGPTGATFQWSPSTGLSSATASNPTASPTITTQYTVTVTSGVGCASTDIVNVTVNQNPIVDAGPDQTICNGFSATIGGSPTGASGVTFAWTPSATLSSATVSNPVASPTVTTTYTVVITDGNGCTATDQVDVIVNQSPTVDAGPDQAVCPGGSIAIGGTPTGPSGSTYAWSPSATLAGATTANPVATPTATTTYTVTVTDGNGCTNTDDVVVTVNNVPTADAGLDQTICNGSGVVIGGSPTGPTGATYQWSPSTGLSSVTASNPTASPTITTQYTVTVTSGVGCTSTDIVNVTVNQNPIVDAGPDQTICNGFSATIGGSPTGAPGVTFAWTPSATLSSATVSNPVASPTVTTTYTVVITDGNGCTATDQVDVIVNQSPTVDAGPDLAVCNGGSLAIGGSPTGPSGSSYAWTPAATLNDPTLSNPIATPTATTTYTVIITDANGCTNTDDVVVSVNALPTADAGRDTAICLGESTPIGGTPTGPAGATFTWSPITGLSNSTASNPVANPSITTTYTVTITDGNGCTATDDVVVTINPLPVVDAGADVFVCINDTIQIGGAPTGPIGSTYAWTPAASIVDATAENPRVFPSVSTTYTVIVTDINGCTNTDDVLVSVNPLPTIDAGDSAYVCPGFSEQLQANGGVSYVWDADPTLSSLTISNPVATPLVSTTYFVTGTDANGCSNRDSVFVLVAPDVPTDAGVDQSICLNDSVRLGGNSSSPLNTIYSWSPTAGLSDPTIANPMASPSVTTKYFLITTNDTCTGVDSVTISVNPIVTADFSATTICQNDSTSFSDLSGVVSGTITNWLWDFGDGSVNSTLQNPKHLYLTSGTFNVKLVVTSDVGCLDSITQAVIVNPNPISDAGSDQTICFGDTVTIGGSPTGDPANLFSWTPALGLDNASIANPRAFPQTTTKYFVTVTDANGCTGLDSMEVIVNPLPLVDAGADITICDQASAQLQSTGAVTYTWSPAATLSDPTISNPIASPNDTTMYFVIGVDANGCQNIDSMTVFVSPRPVALFEADTVCEGNPTTFTDLSSVSSGAITGWVWDFGDGVGSSTLQNPTYTYASDGEYTVQLIATSGLSCSDTFNLQVKVDSLPLLDAGADIAYCIGDTAQVQATGAVSYVWTPAAGLSDPTIANPQVFVTTTTTYTVTGTGANGCSTTDDILVTVNPLPVIDAGNDLEICIGDTVVIGGTPSGPATASYKWTPAIGLDFDTVQNPLASPQVTTKYFLEVTDGNSCVAIDSIEVIVNPLPVIDAGADTAICKNTPLQLNATGAATYLWTPTRGLSDPFIANPIAILDTTTTYVITGTDTNGCISTDTLLIEVLDVDFVSDIELCEGESVTLNPQLSGDTAGVTYLWTPSRTITSTTVRNPLVSPLATTKYFLTVTNAAGCVAVDSVTITVNVTPIPEFNIDFTASCSGLESRVQNFTINGIVHLWNVNGSDDTLISFEPDLGLRYNTTNQVTLIAVNNTCADTLTKSIEVGEVDNYLNLTQTNIFSPNGDGINDAFVVEFKGEFVNCAEILIFNRWGDVVYTSNVERSGWDGRTQSGEKAPSGTYFYVIKLADAEIKGSVMLSR